MAKPKEQWEEEAISRFIAFLNQRRGTVYAITGRDVRPDPSSGKDFDYQIQDAAGNRVAVEIFRLIEDGKELAQGRVWGQIVGLLKEELLNRGIKGYLVSTPYFSVRKSQYAAYSAELATQLETAIRSNEGKDKFDYSGFEFRRIESLQTVVFSVSGGARFVDPTGTSAKSFVDLLPTKNRQLATQGHERILLILNWAFFVSAGDAIHAVSNIDFTQFANIDRIYFEQKAGEFYQIFDRSVLDAVGGRSVTPEISPLLLETLRYKLGDKDPSAFDFVKQQTITTSDMSWLDDDVARANLVHFGEELLQNEALDDVIWIIRQLKNDPDPAPTGANGANDPKGEFNYHAKVLAGEDSRIITTVRGHLCWLMMRLICQNKPDYYAEIIEILDRYISEPNLYIRTQATYPLLELIVRRRATRNQDGSPFNWNPSERARVVEMAFRMLHENAAYPRVLESVLHIFGRFRDLKSDQVAQVLEIFLRPKADYIDHDLAALVVYYAFFRKQQYADLGDFDDERFKTLLGEQVTSGTSAMRSSLAWQFWKVMEENALPYEQLREYLPRFWATGYDRHVASMFGLVFEQIARKSPADAIDLFERMLHLLKNDLLEHPSDRANYWVNGIEHVFPLLHNHPARLVDIAKILRDIWLAGCPFVGDMPTIFQSYASVSTPEREPVRRELQSIYAEMTIFQPRLPAIKWDLGT